MACRTALMNFNCLHGTNGSAGITFDTEIVDYLVLDMRFEENGLCRTFLGAECAADAGVVDGIFDEFRAFPGGTFPFEMRKVLFPEVL